MAPRLRPFVSDVGDIKPATEIVRELGWKPGWLSAADLDR
jgi:hypothetical protein